MNRIDIIWFRSLHMDVCMGEICVEGVTFLSLHSVCNADR